MILWSNWTVVGFSVKFLSVGDMASRSLGIQRSANLGKELYTSPASRPATSAPVKEDKWRYKQFFSLQKYYEKKRNHYYFIFCLTKFFRQIKLQHILLIFTDSFLELTWKSSEKDPAFSDMCQLTKFCSLCRHLWNKKNGYCEYKSLAKLIIYTRNCWWYK